MSQLSEIHIFPGVLRLSGNTEKVPCIVLAGELRSPWGKDQTKFRGGRMGNEGSNGVEEPVCRSRAETRTKRLEQEAEPHGTPGQAFFPAFDTCILFGYYANRNVIPEVTGNLSQKV